MNASLAPRHIFREYDIRGLAETELTDETVERVGQAFGTFLVRGKGIPRNQDPTAKVAVGHDLRPSSKRLGAALIEGLLSAGVEVLDLGLIPTPLLYFGIVHFKQDAGIAITGSHNPPEYNGFKFQLADRPFYGADLQRLRDSVERKDFERVAVKGAKKETEEVKGVKRERSGREGYEGSAKERMRERGTCQAADVITPYLAALESQFHLKKKSKIVIDSGHGMSGLVAPRLFRELGQEVVELYTNLDPTFPDHHPDPSVLENLEDLSRAVRRNQASLGIAFDGDADRIGVVDEKGEPILGDRLLLIYARPILKKHKGAPIIGDVKCSPLIYQDIARHGGRPILWKTGHSLIKAKMKEEKATFGGEMSGHMFFADRWYGFDDAIYAACRIVEILDEEKRPLSQLLSDLPRVVSTPEIRIAVADDAKKFDIVRAVVHDLKVGATKSGTRYRVIDLDGARIEFDDGFGLIRASNTQPVLVMRFEATSEKRLKEIRELIEGKAKKHGGSPEKGTFLRGTGF